ncbi:BREX-2 system phosphatase PglZ [Streptomyces sp. WM6378]|uniref:BREX-2 system phosphatase PglZ n=1 Tax=Streptomyces sp. WM6378 TaxID=1415557 RepID=UPI0006AFA68B|nr:BREX-2 system phosphatase PglZ [Streptomyces sp. WM6378]KOU48478.1 bacteriophage resistance protein [Streptomyces sp. WM6378]
MSIASTTVAVRLNLATVTQYLSSQSSLTTSLAGSGRRRAVLLRSAPQWDGPAAPAWGDGLSARIAPAPSPLAVHELLLDHLDGKTAGPPVLVVLTDREQNELDPAILARAHKKRIDTVDSWDVVRDAFRAQQVDPRLKESNWAAEALLDATPPKGGGWPPVAGGMLSRRTALSSLALRRLRLGRYASEAQTPGRAPVSDALDPHALFAWSLTAGGPELMLELRRPERDGLAAFLGEEDQAGPAGRALLALVAADHGADAVAFGLVCAALWVHCAPDAVSYRARGRAERWFGEQPLAKGDELDLLVSRFAVATEEYVGSLLTSAARADSGDSETSREARRLSDTVLDRASVLVRQFGAEDAAETSALLAAGLEARFAAVGRALADGQPRAVSDAVRALGEHKRADGPEALARVERARMAQRLAQWLAGDPAGTSDTVADALQRHTAETGWVDSALEHIEAGGDPAPVLKAAYDTLGEQVRRKRHEIDGAFARALAIWTSAGTGPGSMLTVETFLDRVVKPVVRRGTDRRVLLLVLDGMSSAIAGELAEELRASWAEFDPLDEGAPRRRAMAAALPTLTTVCRTSLFAGRLTKGTQADEKKLFPTHAFWDGTPAAVFHKDELRAEGSGDTFGPALTEALGDGRTHVAVVLNTIDDRLAKEQKLGDGAWHLDEIGRLRDLLRVAAAQGMAVILTSDHGHVVDRRDVKVNAAAPDSARHRAPGGPLAEAEVVLSGPRVVWPEADGSIVALWDADSRYTTLKAGYHGGASLREFTIPVLAFLPFGATPPESWRELGDQRPAWWFLEKAQQPPVRPAAQSPASPALPEKQSRQKPTKAQAELAQTHDSLFDVALVPAAEHEGVIVTPVLVAPDDALITALLVSDAFKDQVGLLARKPPLDKLEKAIRALLEAGGTLPVTAVAQRVDYPATRADGFAAVLRQVLNYDGVQVLQTLPDGRTLRLDRSLLQLQFGV